MPWVELVDPPKSAIRRIKETFAGRAKYLVDESVGTGVYRYIQSLGHNVRFGPDLGLRTDQEVFARGWCDRRVILTHDHDFMNDREFPFNRNPGVIELPGASGVPVGLQEAVLTVLNILGHVRAVAERVGFEPTSRLRSLRFSRPVQSTALPPLRSNQLRGLRTFYQAADPRRLPAALSSCAAPQCHSLQPRGSTPAAGVDFTARRL
jgi:predicted nuclease of predicted toxin-antitoxin system